VTAYNSLKVKKKKVVITRYFLFSDCLGRERKQEREKHEHRYQKSRINKRRVDTRKEDIRMISYHRKER
jgi:hypothetical protein